MDCEHAMLLIARRREQTLTGKEIAQLGSHVEGCRDCDQLASETDPNPEGWAWVARVPEDALDDPDLLTLPTVDPSLFDIEGTIARGGMGRILRARDRRLGRTIAIKEVVADDILARFEREAMVTARLQHPSIIPIYEAGMWPEGTAFYTMRLVSGETLTDAIESRETIASRLELLPNLIAASEALAYAHSEGVIHRDLKPHNILVGDFGETVVIDWGLAKFRGEDEENSSGFISTPRLNEITIAGEVLGSPCFMAPEQADAKPADERSDVYALGAILYMLLSGSMPYRDAYPDSGGLKLVDLARNEPPTPIEELARDAPADLLAICTHAMAREPSERYADAKELASELRRFEAGQLIAGKDYSAGELIGRWVQRHRTLLSVISLAAVASIAVGVIAIVNITQSRDEARTSAAAAKKAKLAADARADELVLRQALDSLDTDPTKTLAWLKKLPNPGVHSRAAALLAAEAIERGVSEDIFDAQNSSPHRLSFIRDDRALLLESDYAPARVIDLDKGHFVDLHRLTFAFWDPVKSEFFGPSPDEDGLLVEKPDDDPSAKAKRVFEAPIESIIDDPGSGRTLFATEHGFLVWTRGKSAFSTRPMGGQPLGLTAGGSKAVARLAADESLVVWQEGAEAPVAKVSLPKRVSFPAQPGEFAVGRALPVVAMRRAAANGVFLWNHGTGKTAQVVTNKRTQSLALSVDDTRLATGTTDGWLQIFDTLTFERACYRKLPSAITAFEYAADGTLAIGLDDGTVVIGPDCGPPERTLRGHSDRVTALAFSRDGKRLASAAKDKSVRVHRRLPVLPIKTSKLEKPEGCRVYWLKPAADSMWFLCSTKSGSKYVRTGGQGRAEVEEANEKIGRNGAKPSSDGKSLALGPDYGKQIRIWRDGESVTMTFDTAGPWAVTDDGSTIHRVGRDGTLETWDVATQKMTDGRDVGATEVVPSPDGSALAVDLRGGIAVLDASGIARGGTRLDDFAHERMVWSADSTLAGFTIGGGTILVYDRAAKRWLRLDGRGDIEVFAFTKDRGVVAVSGRFLHAWDLETGALHRRPLPPDFNAYAVVVDGDKATLYDPQVTVEYSIPQYDRRPIDANTRTEIDERGDPRTPR